MTSTVQLVIMWQDVALAWEPEKRDGFTRMLLPQDDIWKPDISLMNGFEKIAPLGAAFMNVDVRWDGYVQWKPLSIVETTCTVDMTHFPYDTQICPLQVGAWSDLMQDIY